jgi:hypothetical protein
MAILPQTAARRRVLPRRIPLLLVSPQKNAYSHLFQVSLRQDPSRIQSVQSRENEEQSQTPLKAASHSLLAALSGLRQFPKSFPFKASRPCSHWLIVTFRAAFFRSRGDNADGRAFLHTANHERKVGLGCRDEGTRFDKLRASAGHLQCMFKGEGREMNRERVFVRVILEVSGNVFHKFALRSPEANGQKNRR